MDIMKLRVLEWSAHQRAFHEHTVAQMLEENRRAMVGKTNNKHYDWVPVAIAEDSTELVRWQERNDPRKRHGDSPAP